MYKRIRNASIFYVNYFRNEFRKELQLINNLANGKDNVAYMGWTGFANLGDEILYEAHKKLFPNLNIVQFRRSPFEILYKIVFRKNIYKAGFLGGGTLINQSNSWITQIKYLEKRGLPIYCLGTGVMQDDFRAKHEDTSLELWIKTLKLFKYVGIRGPRSQDILKNANFNSATIVGDTALSLATSTYLPSNNSRVVGINYGLVNENMIWGDGDKYSANLVRFIKRLIKNGYTVHLLPVWDKDISSNKMLLKLVDDPNCKLIIQYESLSAYQEELRKCSVFFGQKLHATIMACMLRIPSVMIEYQPKCRDFMESIEMEELVIRTSDFQPVKALELLDKLLGQYESIQSTIDKNVNKYRSIQNNVAKQIEISILS